MMNIPKIFNERNFCPFLRALEYKALDKNFGRNTVVLVRCFFILI